MKTQEKIDFIANNSNALAYEEIKLIDRIYRSLKAKVEANEETDEILSDVLYSYGVFFKKRLELYDLKDLLSNYANEKGLKHSLLRIEELVSMISSDYQQNYENMRETKETIKAIKKFLNKS